MTRARSKGTEEFRQNPRNHNKGTERGSGAIRRSIERLGAGRSIVVDKNGVVIAGNHALGAAQELGLQTRTVETDGKTLVVVRRKDLDLESDGEAVELAYADNRTSAINWDLDEQQLVEDLAAGVDLSVSFTKDELEELVKEAGADGGGGEEKVTVKLRFTKDEKGRYDSLLPVVATSLGTYKAPQTVIGALERAGEG